MQEEEKKETTNENIPEENVVKQENTKEETTVEEIAKNIKGEAQKIKEEAKKQSSKSIGMQIKSFIKEPIQTIQQVAQDEKYQYFILGMILLGIWSVASFISSFITILSSFHYKFASIFAGVKMLFGWVGSILTPGLAMLTITLIVLLYKKKNKKSFLQILLTAIFAKIPVVIGAVAEILTIIPFMSSLVIPFKGFCYVLSIILTYFGIKSLLEEQEDNKFIKHFILIEAIYFGIAFVLRILGIGIMI